jgi:CHRD domain-containing protein
MSAVRRVLLTVALGAAVGAGPAITSPAMAHSGTGYQSLSAFLTGSQEVPDPGDADGWGVANVRVWPSTGKLCYTLFVRRVSEPAAAHIHAGKRGTSGDVKVELNAPVHGWSVGCETIDPALAAKIAAKPQRYYVNVHSMAFSNGAVRGQLFKRGAARW